MWILFCSPKRFILLLLDMIFCTFIYQINCLCVSSHPLFLPRQQPHFFFFIMFYLFLVSFKLKCDYIFSHWLFTSSQSFFRHKLSISQKYLVENFLYCSKMGVKNCLYWIRGCVNTCLYRQNQLIRVVLMCVQNLR